MIVQTDRTLIRSTGNSRRHVLVTFTAPDSPRVSSRAPVNVAFVLDRSGSMGGSKIGLAKKALVQALQMLRPFDRFSVVFYDDRIDLLVPSTKATTEAVSNAVRQVERIQARGNTNLGGGWLEGCEQIAEHLQGAQIGKCLLLTDSLRATMALRRPRCSRLRTARVFSRDPNQMSSGLTPAAPRTIASSETWSSIGKWRDSTQPARARKPSR
jgi:Mg-chelatase subunit ChlD